MIEGREQIRIGERIEPAMRIRQRFNGISVVSWLDGAGRTLKEETPAGFSLVRQSPLEAQSLSSTRSVPLDLITQTSITPDRPILSPEQKNLIKLKLSGINLANFPLMNAGRQRLNQDQLEIRREEVNRLKSVGLPVRQRRLDPFLQPTVFMQSDHPKISRLAAEIVRGETDARKAALKIKDWVYNEIAKEPTVSIPNALEVLQTKKGDCNEHTVLFNAIARAAGIPAKTVVGVVYLRDAFYYHAWSEVWIGEWISVDSVLNQFPADATHIKFLEGEIDRQIDILQLIGNLKISIIEAPNIGCFLEILADSECDALLTKSARSTKGSDLTGSPMCNVPDLRAPWKSTRCNMIKLVNLAKHYGRLRVDSLNLEVQAGEIFGFLGPNGAGKTTTIRVMMGILKPTSGQVFLGGYDVDGNRKKPKRSPVSSRTGLSFMKSSAAANSCSSSASSIVSMPSVLNSASRTAGALRAGSVARRAGGKLLPRHEAATRRLRVADTRTADSRRRRTDGGNGPQRRTQAEGSVSFALRAGHDGISLDPQHQRRRGDLPQNRHHSKRPADRLRHHGGFIRPSPKQTGQPGKRLSRIDPRQAADEVHRNSRS